MDSNLVVDIVKAAPNVCGVKLTCANVGKLTRIMAQINKPKFDQTYPRKKKEIPFTAIDGFIDFPLPSIAVGAGGAISGLPNIAPVCVIPPTHERLLPLNTNTALNGVIVGLREALVLVSISQHRRCPPGGPGASKHHLLGRWYRIENRRRCHLNYLLVETADENTRFLA